jgi:vacuolar protein sorting-associated protein 16
MNPFDDSDTNPFSTVGNGNISSSLNPFDTDGPIGSVDEEEEDDLLEDEEPLDSSLSAEASWQYLGDLPYRRIPIYTNVRWGEDSRKGPKNRSEQDQQYGLARFSLLQSSKTTQNFSNPRILLSKTTITKCVGCPNGGPIAIVTLPLTVGVGSLSPPASSLTTVPIRICTVSGKLLACIDFPPPISGFSNHRPYVPADILTLGFTTRCTLVVVLKDSFCFTYNLRGEPILPPFYILENAGADLLQLAHVYEGGVAVVSSRNQDAALVELLDQHDSPEYVSTVHPSARRILPTSTTKNPVNATSSANQFSSSNDGLPANYAMVTYLPTGLFAATHTAKYCALAVLPRTRTASRHPEVFLSTSDHSVIVVNSVTLQCTDVNCRARIASPIVDMCFAPNGRFLACFTESSMLTVISTSFETKVLDFDTSEGSNSPPLEMKWCGEDSVVLHWKNLGILMVGPYGDWLRFPYEGMEHVFLLPEMDCCRVITDTSVEILQRVPPTTALLLRIGSIDPAAMLLDAADAFYAGGSSNGDTTRSMIEGGLLEGAIEACTDAAKKEFDILTQKRLLRAASYGMHFSYKILEGKSLMGGPAYGSEHDDTSSYRVLPSKTTAKFVDTARSIRIMNALRHPDVGMVVSAAQWEAMTPAGLVARLVALQRPALAAAIANYLHLPNSMQLFARAAMAAAFIAAAPATWSDSEIAERAIRIINGTKNAKDSTKSDASHNMNRGGYAAVAMTAHSVGRPGVASLLLMLESSVAEKVPALISTGSYADALAVATTAR